MSRNYLAKTGRISGDKVIPMGFERTTTYFLKEKPNISPNRSFSSIDFQVWLNG